MQFKQFEKRFSWSKLSSKSRAISWREDHWLHMEACRWASLDQLTPFLFRFYSRFEPISNWYVFWYINPCKSFLTGSMCYNQFLKIDKTFFKKKKVFKFFFWEPCSKFLPRKIWHVPYKVKQTGLQHSQFLYQREKKSQKPYENVVRLWNVLGMLLDENSQLKFLLAQNVIIIFCWKECDSQLLTMTINCWVQGFLFKILRFPDSIH